MLIYSEQVTERLLYTLDFIFKSRGIQYSISNDPIAFSKSNEILFNYSEREFDGIPTLIPSDLLFSLRIKNYNIDLGDFNGKSCLNFNGITDPLASIFYVLSRYEEYTNFRRDHHDRFLAKDSILNKFSWIATPICDHWAVEIIKCFSPELTMPKAEFSILPTFDIDSSYAYLRKNSLRNAFAYWRDRILGKKDLAEERKKVREGIIKDPFDTYDYILEKTSHFSKVHFFWLLGNFSRYDRNIAAEDPIQKLLIERISKNRTVGIHPSYLSNNRPFQIKEEIFRLQEIIQAPIVSSRQHFLKLSLPQSYRKLIEAGIKEDYTMGFADIAGFRLGTAKNIPWFDLQNNIKTDLILYPFMYMDGTLNQYMKLTPTQAIETLLSLKKEVQQYGGNFSFIWHNETMAQRGIWKDWLPVFESSLKE